MEWTKEAPKAAGYYWVWQSEDDWPCNGHPRCVIVGDANVGTAAAVRLAAWVPFMDYSEDVVEWADAYWIGPLELPPIPGIVSSVASQLST